MVAILNDNELSEKRLGVVRVFGGKAARFRLMPDDDEVEEEEDDADEVGVDPEDLCSGVACRGSMRRAA
jgi:hypothetical protein